MSYECYRLTYLQTHRATTRGPSRPKNFSEILFLPNISPIPKVLSWNLGARGVILTVGGGGFIGIMGKWVKYLKTFFRFINTLRVNKLDSELAWKFVKNARANYYLKKKKIKYCLSIFYDDEEELLNIFSNLVMSGSNVTEEILEVNDDVLKREGHMFIYLITCPTKGAILLKRIFRQQVTGIFASLKKIVEKSNDEDMVDVAKEVLGELMTILEFQYVAKKDNSAFGMTKNVTNVKGT